MDAEALVLDHIEEVRVGADLVVGVGGLGIGELAGLGEHRIGHGLHDAGAVLVDELVEQALDLGLDVLDRAVPVVVGLGLDGKIDGIPQDKAGVDVLLRGDGLDVLVAVNANC